MFLLTCNFQCSVSLPLGAVGWYVIVTLPGHTHLLFWLTQQLTLSALASAQIVVYRAYLYHIDKQKAFRRDCIYNNKNTHLHLGIACVYFFDTHRCSSLTGSFYALGINRFKWNDPKVITQKLWSIYRLILFNATLCIHLHYRLSICASPNRIENSRNAHWFFIANYK